jgi:hypothetical protein
MAKVSIGLRGWRFDEDEVFADNGQVRPLGNMEPDTRQRIVRLTDVMDDPCDCCYLIHGESDVEQCNPARAVYGEPMGEVVLCNDHEPDFVYWFQEEGGSDLAGHRELQNAFHEWFAAGNRTPEDWGEFEHVEEDPENLPEPPHPEDELPGIQEEMAAMPDEELEALDVDLDALDL